MSPRALAARRCRGHHSGGSVQADTAGIHGGVGTFCRSRNRFWACTVGVDEPTVSHATACIIWHDLQNRKLSVQQPQIGNIEHDST